MNAEEHIKAGLQLMSNEEWEAAINSFSNAIKLDCKVMRLAPRRNPASVKHEALFRIGLACSKLGEHEAAVDNFEELSYYEPFNFYYEFLLKDESEALAQYLEADQRVYDCIHETYREAEECPDEDWSPGFLIICAEGDLNLGEEDKTRSAIQYFHWALSDKLEGDWVSSQEIMKGTPNLRRAYMALGNQYKENGHYRFSRDTFAYAHRIYQRPDFLGKLREATALLNTYEGQEP